MTKITIETETITTDLTPSEAAATDALVATNMHLMATLKELREFVGAMGRVAIEEWHGVYQDGEFWFFADDGEGIASGTDPFDAWRKMNAGEGINESET